MLIIDHLAVSVDEKPILNDLCLQVAPGSFHALMGPNGSGKSTLAYTLMGHPRYQVTAGSITFNGHDITQLSPDKRAKLGIFLAFQHPLEIPGVSITTFLKEAHQALTGQQLSVAAFNEQLQAAAAVLNLDPSFIYRNVNEGFSGGEKKRLELLQILMLKPSCIILDETDSGLDIDALALIKRVIDGVRLDRPETVVLMITHYPRMVALMQPDAVHILAKGTVVKTGDATLAHAIEQKGYDGAVVN